MINLATSGTLKGKAGTTTAITYTIYGDSATTTDAFQVLGQGQLPTSTGDLLTVTPVPASTALLVKEIHLANTTGGNVSGIVLYANGTAAANQITGTMTIPANGTATYNGEWSIYDASGVKQYVGSTGPSGTVSIGSVTNIGSAGPPTVTNVGTGAAAILNFGLQQGATGSTGAAGVVQAVTAADGSITVGGTTANPTIQRPALTGDVTASAGSNATTLAAGSASNLNSGTLPAGRLPALTGDVTSSAGSSTTAIAAGVIVDGDINASAAIAGSKLAAATTSTPGSMSAVDKTTVNNLWYDVTNYGVSIGNSGAANVTALNTLIQTTAPAGARFFFPSTGANYPMTGTVTVTQNYQSFIGTGMRSSVIFCANTTADLFVLTDGVRNITFQDLGFWSTGTATAGTMLRCGTPTGSGNAQVNIYRCGAEGFGGNWYDLILYNGTLAGLLCNIEDCNFNAFTHYGIGIICNTSTFGCVSANIISNTTLNGNINGTTGATAGIFVRQSGALQITNSDIIQCTNNLLVQPASSSEISASIYADNSYFDSSYGSCVKIAGSGPVVRAKFTSCSLTVAGGSTGYAAFEVNSAAANAPAGIDILNCSIQNTFNNSGTSNGLLLTTIADTKIEGNNISGFTNGIQATPFAGGTQTRLNIIGNTIGPAGGIKGNTTGILLNAGATTYGMVQILDNVFPFASPYGAANTTNITDNSTTALSSPKIMADNSGIVVASRPIVATSAGLNTTETYVPTAVSLPPSSALVGTTLRLTLLGTNTSTTNTPSTFTVRIGTTGTTPLSDTTCTAALGVASSAAGTAIPFTVQIMVTFRAVGAATAIQTFMTGVNVGATGLSNVTNFAVSAAGSGTFNNNVQLYLNVSYKTSATTCTSTFTNAIWEVLAQ